VPERGAIRHQYTVYDVYHAVAHIVVSRRYFRPSVNVHTIGAGFHQQIFALQRLQLLRRLQVLAVYRSPGNHVVVENVVQSFDVLWLQQLRKYVLIYQCKGVVGRGE